MIGRRTLLAGGAAALGLAGWAGRSRLLAELVPEARTSSDSRWYAITAVQLQRLRDLSTAGWSGLSPNAINNRHLIDLRDVAGPERLQLAGSRRILVRDEAWELSAEQPELGNDVGYPSLVRGHNGLFYVYYAIHDPDSGIGLAVGSRPDGPFVKARSFYTMADSRVLRAPPRPRRTSHYSSPVVLWNAERACWHLYFHFYDNRFEQGHGHQRTALATSTDLVNWAVMTGDDGGILAVLPTTRARWMNSQSTYHSIFRLPNGLWVAWLRGIGGGLTDGVFEQDTSALGFAVSNDGIRWALVPGAPQLVPGRKPVRRLGVIRPAFAAVFGSGLHCCWIESDPYDGAGSYVLARTEDFRRFTAVPSPFAELPKTDGPLAPWRDGDTLLMTAGPIQYRFRIT